MKKIFLLTIMIISLSQLFGQSFTDSNLPIVVIEIDGFLDIPDEPKIWGDMKIISRAGVERNFLSDQNNEEFLDYHGRIKIETRGSSSSLLPKRHYGFTTYDENSDKLNVSLLGMPKENDWILNNIAFDSSLVREYLCYNLSRQIGEYAPRTQYCEVVLNGSYRGLYILLEKIKADDSRVDIDKIAPSDNELPELTGGYITKADKINEKDSSAWVMWNHLNVATDFIHEVPKQDEVTFSQNDYIHSEFERLSNTLIANNASFQGGFPAVIDIPSFVDFMLINELSANVDAYQFSTFFHKDRNAKLRAGPIWDLNLTFGNDLIIWGFDRSHTNTWQFDDGDNIGPSFWKGLFDQSDFNCQLSKRWHELTQPGQPLNITSIEAFLDSTYLLIEEASVRENLTWGKNNDLSVEFLKIKYFLRDRINWMTDNLGPYESCSNVVQPALVISKIHYHPITYYFAKSNDQEFIEILNNGSDPIDLTGIYFGGTGLVYQFPPNSSIAAGERIMLANNRIKFHQKYGYEPFDEFTRSLANDGQTITLLDGFGNEIDAVTYLDEAPWPDADGNNFYLELIDPAGDNNDPANWQVQQDIDFVLSESKNKIEKLVQIYPNPSINIFKIESEKNIELIIVRDLSGKLLLRLPVHQQSHELDIQGFEGEVFLLEIFTSQGRTTHKILKH